MSESDSMAATPLFLPTEPEEPQELIPAYKQEYISGEALLNSIMRYDGWRVLVQAEAPAEPAHQCRLPSGNYLGFTRDEHANACISLFSSPATLLDADYTAEEIEQVSGAELFHALPDGFAHCYIDPQQPTSIDYPASALPQLREWGGMVFIDQALERLLTAAEPTQADLALLYHFGDYRIVLTRVGDAERLAMAPDRRERNLAAVFTGPAAVSPYLDWLLEHIAPKEPPLPFTLAGADLFARLRELQLEGLVFNPLGPLPARAFGPQLLASLPGDPPERG
jgi:hypothetical protein